MLVSAVLLVAAGVVLVGVLAGAVIGVRPARRIGSSG